MKYLILLFIPLMLSADYAVKEDILNCPTHWVRYAGQWGQQHCETLNKPKECIEVPVTFKCEYFSEIGGVLQLDTAKKATWDTEQGAKETARTNRIADIDILKGLRSSIKSGTNLTEAQRRKFDLILIRNMRRE